jgi:hypothetical protein
MILLMISPLPRNDTCNLGIEEHTGIAEELERVLKLEVSIQRE